MIVYEKICTGYPVRGNGNFFVEAGEIHYLGCTISACSDRWGRRSSAKSWIDLLKFIAARG